ncbi:Nuclear pore complex protein [Wickerhamomyces ciferrii]|uniref:Nuclear pore complex protein n=1 Tax=Wickerhamomyces ciferrii (strain ATCC 14091 / BCRC 22168 / CBS 111 / JCM 3599 / NBRC 0793 / NRRL Y-1031 F-60-10) TaxID=1206466 RepID=K0KMG3_WICCF|nr:Nuclear pore complex protein [Wickerhamomyces ciferrii]CCH42278.1 Nuclear pore complex protein [Wickerhamomyces ciferrii]
MSSDIEGSHASELQDPVILAKFADTLKDFKQNNTKDVFDIVKEYRSIAASKAYEVASDEDSKVEYQNWELEAKLWHLVDLLISYRNSEKAEMVPTYTFSSNIVHEKNFYTESDKLGEIWLLILWIQEGALEPERPNLSTSKWLNTQLSNTLENLDSDASLRLNKPINPKDQEEDTVFFKYVFELMLAGRFDEAQAECTRTNNWTLRMILAGLNEFLDPVVDKQMSELDEKTQGIKRKALWRRTVYLLSKNEGLNEYERAIYGYLIGDLSPLKLTNTWDSQLLVYLNHILTSEIESTLIDNGKINNEDLILTIPRSELSVQDVLNSVSQRLKDESEHPLRVLIASVISNKISPIIHSSLSLVGSVMLGIEESNEIFSEPYALRVVTHLAIFISLLHPDAVSNEDKFKLLTTYILILRLYEQYELIPIYISFLTETEARDVYSLFLIDLFDPEERSNQLKLSRQYNLPLENILKRTVERVFSTTEEHYQINSGVTLQETDEIDNKLIRGVEWFIEAKMYSDAIHASISLFRRFLLTGRTKAAEEFASRNPLPQLLKNYDVEQYGVLADETVSDNERNELLQYDALIRGLSSINAFANRPKVNGPIANIEYINTIVQQLHSLIESLFLELSYTDYETQIIQELRSLYIPYLIIQLHNIYVDGRKYRNSYLKDALDLVNVVASESSKFYTLFQNCGRLQEYLKLIADCAALAADDGY